MMNALLRTCAATAAVLLFASFQAASAGTIIKLSLGDDSVADIRYSGGILSTINDLDPPPHGATIGDQTTTIVFLDFLSSNPTIQGGSYSLSNVAAVGTAFTFNIGGVPHVAQDFQGGNFKIWDDNDNLLLDVNLGGSALVGPIGQPATAAHFSTTFATVVSGSLASQIAANSMSMSFSMTDVLSNNGQAGLRVAPGSVLRGFTADANKLIAASQIPEPAAAALLGFAAVALVPSLRRARRS